MKSIRTSISQQGRQQENVKENKLAFAPEKAGRAINMTASQKVLIQTVRTARVEIGKMVLGIE